MTNAFMTVDQEAISNAQRAAMADELGGAQLAELQRMKRDPASIKAKVETRLRILKNRQRVLQRAARAEEQLPALEQRLQEAREDLSIQPGMVERIESEARAVAKKAARANPEALEDADRQVAEWKALLDGIKDGDGDSLVTADGLLAELEAERTRRAEEHRKRNPRLVVR